MESDSANTIQWISSDRNCHGNYNYLHLKLHQGVSVNPLTSVLDTFQGKLMLWLIC